jgi:hypothetical protein
MKKSILITVILVIALGSQLYAFDGYRKGFVIGGGLGFAPVGRWSLVDAPSDPGVKTSESRPGISANFQVGYAFDEFNMLVFDADATGYNSKVNDKSSSQGTEAFSWYHYFGPAGKALYTKAGLGIYSFWVDGSGDFSSGLGFVVGGGYEFAPHWQVGANLGFGRTSKSNVDFSHVHIDIGISAVAF